MLEHHFYILVVLLVLFILIFLGVIGVGVYIAFKMITIQENKQQPMKELIDAVKDVKKELKENAEAPKGHFCKNHPGIKAAGTCAICGNMFCEDCLMESDNLNFCREHFRVYNETDWSPIEDVKTDPHNPEKAMYIYDFKQKTWKDKMLPMYVVTHYQIDVDTDDIVTQITLYGPRSDQFLISGELKNFKNKQKKADQ